MYRNFFFFLCVPLWRQSFETELDIQSQDLDPSSQCHGVFIRAPAIVKINSDKVEILARLKPEQRPALGSSTDSRKSVTSPLGSAAPADGSDEQCVVAARQGNLLVTAFHVSILLWDLGCSIRCVDLICWGGVFFFFG